MAIGIYKKGQGYWTRTMSAIGLGLIVLMGAVWASDLFANVRIAGREPVYTRALVFVIVFTVFGLLGYHFIGRKPRVVDFMIATEGEMKKVNWSTRREILGSTWVVIGFTLVVALLCALFDISFAAFFRGIGVLEATG